MKPEQVDIRYAVSDNPPPNGGAVLMRCTKHLDDKQSLAVYPGNIHCFGCGFHLSRRYESLAFVLGLWNGDGDGYVPAIQASKQAHLYVGRKSTSNPIKAERAEINASVVLSYRIALWQHEDLLSRFMQWRGLSKETVERFGIGYDLCRWTIPIYDINGGLVNIRFRNDDDLCESDRKYSGVHGRNQTHLYPAKILKDYTNNGQSIDELWVVEGELDVLPLWQRGIPAVSTTNGVLQSPQIIRLLMEAGCAFKRICIALDLDTPGHKGAKQLLETCVDMGIDSRRALWDNGKDTTEFFVQGGKLEDIVYEERPSSSLEELPRARRRRPDSLLRDR